MAKGYLALVLHTHLPFVRHPESANYLEERWLFEAITESYVPLLQVMQGLILDGVDFRLTMSFSPALLAMLTDELLQQRYLNHITQLIDLAEREAERTSDLPKFHPLAENYLARFTAVRDFYLKYECNLVMAFRELESLGVLESITSAATHAFLPLVMTEEGIRAQLKIAIAMHEQEFGQKPKGIWLPECGYVPGLDAALKELGVDYFFIDTHGLGLAEPTPVFGVMSPVITPNGVAAFARDEECSKQVWSSKEGYPGDYDYREYYRDIGYDLDYETIKPFIHPEGIRVNTGIKYFRITGSGEYKEPYNLEWAREKAARHAGNFMFNRQQQAAYWSEQMGRKPIIAAPFDTELFGHWWYEGPLWIDFLFRKMHFDQDVLKLITPGEYLKLHSDYQVCYLPASTWGRGGYMDVWLQRENDWVYPALHMAEKHMVHLANGFDSPRMLEKRALNQAARELMLAQSSDWAFIMDSKSMVDYAVKRVRNHINRFMRLREMLLEHDIDEVWLSQIENMDNIFPFLDYRVYRTSYSITRFDKRKGPRVLILSWEFPPLVVGGLARHVHDLARFLVRQGWEVHILTTEIGEYPHTEVMDGIHIHRVHVLKPDGGEFLHWVFQLNLMMIDACEGLLNAGLKFDLIHAHDWLVYYAAKSIKEQYGLPLVATIHATEHGRNQGIRTDLQRYIHECERQLTHLADRVIVCSSYMKNEVTWLFDLEVAKVEIIPNGIDPGMLSLPDCAQGSKEPYAMQHEQVILFMGRLVREKGVHVLLEAAPAILRRHPDAKFVIAGKGPSEEELRRRVAELGISHKVRFAGFIEYQERNILLSMASAAVFPSLYEPFGIVVLEAMGAGTPVIVSDVGGLADIVQHGRNGRKVYPGDIHSLEVQIHKTLKYSDKAREMAERALAEIDKYDWEMIARRTIEVYGSVLPESLKEGAFAK